MNNPILPATKPPLLKHNVPILTFFSRFWLLSIFTVLLNCVPLWSHAWFYLPMGNDEWGNAVWRGVTTFEVLGSVSYIPGIVLAWFWINAFGLHLYFRSTLDKDAHDNTYSDAWAQLPPKERVLYSVILRVGMALGAAIIVAGIVK